MRVLHCLFKALLFVFSLLNSCNISMPKNQERENFIPPPTIDKSIDEALMTPFFSLGDWPEENWWEAFDSPQLNELMISAIEQNPSLQEVRARLNVAYEESIITKAQLFPWISLDSTYTKEFLSHNGLYRAFNSTLPLNANLTDIFLKLQYDCDFWGKNRHLYLAAVGESKAQEAEVAQVKLVITTAIAQAYVTLKANLLRKIIYENLANVSFKTFELQKLLKDKALFSRLSVLSFEEAYLEAKKMVHRINEEIAIQKHLVNTLIGRGPDENLEVDARLPSLPQTLVIPCDLSIDLLARRPDLMIQIWRVEALSHEVGAAMGEFYPDINFSVLMGLESTLFKNLFDMRSKTYTFAPAFHLPLFTAGAIQANVKANKAAFDEAVFNYNGLLLSSAQEVADILSISKSIFLRREEQVGIIESARERLDLTLLLKKSGLNNLFDSYNVQIELLNNELEDVNLIYGEYLSMIRLMKALGGGYQRE